MPYDWERLKADGAVLLVHVSDLHIGSDRSVTVWKEVYKELKRIRPHRMLVSGDLVHTPREDYYSTARKCIDAVGVPYFVCPGNHDRFPYGNRWCIRLVPKSLLTRCVLLFVVVAISAFTVNGLLIGGTATPAQAIWINSLAVAVGALLLFVMPWFNERLIRGLPKELFERAFEEFGPAPEIDVDSIKDHKTPSVIEHVSRWFQEHVSCPWKVSVAIVLVSALFAAAPLLIRPAWSWVESLVCGLGAVVVARIGYALYRSAAIEKKAIAQLEPCNDEVQQNHNSWKIGILATDSSFDADFSARGHVDRGFATDLVAGTRNRDWDLCILMVHHHVLSIRKLEHDNQESRGNLLNLTCMVNSGTLLDEVSKAQIDLVLHGHEHAENEAAFGSLADGGGTTRVLAAASATGNVTLEGCSVTRASFNVLILRPDRSVKIVRVKYSGGWVNEDVAIIEAAELRHSQLRRGCDLDHRRIRTEITKHVVYTHDRDIRVYWRFTHRKLTDGAFEHPVWNATGKLVDVVVRVPPISGRDAIDLVTESVPIPGKIPGYRIRCPVPNQPESGTLDWVELSYGWERGAFLTEQEMLQARASGLTLEPFRGQGYEYETIWTDRPMAALNVIISLPPGFAGQWPEVQVFEPASAAGEPVRVRGQEKELTDRLVAVAPGHFSLQIPYPRIGYDYSLVWKPVSEAEVESRMATYARQFAGVDSETAKKLVDAFVRELQDTTFASRINVGLYVPSQDRKHLVCIDGARFGPGNARTATAKTPNASLRGPVNIVSLAWSRGTIEAAARPANLEDAVQAGFASEEEVAVVCVPIRFAIRAINPQPWAVVRLGFIAVDDPSNDDIVEGGKVRIEPLEHPLFRAAAGLLTAVFRHVRI